MSAAKMARVSLALLAIQLAVVCSIAGKYLIERSTCPRVWTRAVAYDPEMIMRGRYFSMQLHVDACGVKLPPPAGYANQNDINILFDRGGVATAQLEARIGVKDGKLAVLKLLGPEDDRDSMSFQLRRSESCDKAILLQGIDFYIPEHAQSPFPLSVGQELWVEVTVPPAGPPRPTQLALKSSDGTWQPLNYR